MYPLTYNLPNVNYMLQLQQRFSNSSPFDTFANQIVAQQMQQQNSLTDHFSHHAGLQHKLRSSPLQQQHHQSAADWQEGFRLVRDEQKL